MLSWLTIIIVLANIVSNHMRMLIFDIAPMTLKRMHGSTFGTRTPNNLLEVATIMYWAFTTTKVGCNLLA